MKRNERNIYFIIGYIAYFIYLGIGHFIELPDMISGFCAGLSIVMLLIGAYTSRHDVNKLREFKRKLLRNI